MKIRNFLVISLLSIFAVITNVNAGNIAILDVENVVKNSAVMKDVQNKISKKQDEYQKEIDKRQAQLESEGKKLDAKKGILSEEAFNKEQIAFDKKIGDLKDHLDKRQNALKKASFAALEKVNDKIKEIISEISKEKSLDLVIPASQTLYFNDSIDISQEVSKKLNARITKIDVKFD